MSGRFESMPHRRAIIDRRDLSDALIELGDDGDASIRRQRATQILKEALDKGRTEINRRLGANPGRGSEISASHALPTDQILRLLFDFPTGSLSPLNTPTAAARRARAAGCGYGRRGRPPCCNVAIMFMRHRQQTAR